MIDMCGRIGITKQRTYLKYCNGAETFYSYYSTRRRLQNLVVNAKAGTIMDMPIVMTLLATCSVLRTMLHSHRVARQADR